MESIHTDAAFDSSNPNSQAVRVGEMIYLSGQTPLDPDRSGQVVGEGTTVAAEMDVREQTHATFRNIEAVLEAAGSSLDHLVKTTVFFTDREYYEPINDVYGEYVGEPYPARSAIPVGELAVDIDVEIEAIATVCGRNP